MPFTGCWNLPADTHSQNSRRKKSDGQVLVELDEGALSLVLMQTASERTKQHTDPKKITKTHRDRSLKSLQV